MLRPRDIGHIKADARLCVGCYIDGLRGHHGKGAGVVQDYGHPSIFRLPISESQLRVEKTDSRSMVI